MRFLFAFVKDGNNLVKIGMDDGKERWMTCSKIVYGFVKKALKGTDKETGYEGDEVKVTYTNVDGKYNCTRIEKVGGTPTSQRETTTDGKPKCTDCGKELKDNKYSKCYLCNKKNPVKSTGTKTYTKSPEVQESIKRQAIGHMTSRTMIALQGHIDPNNVHEIAESIYNTYVRLVG